MLGPGELAGTRACDWLTVVGEGAVVLFRRCYGG
jgi:hypothetical protein